MAGLYEYVGNIHIHTTYSDGSGSVAVVATEARAAGLDFAIITDHGTLAGKYEEGYHEGVLILVGMEINEKCNHYLALNLREEVLNCDARPQKVIDEVRKRGGIGFLAHPMETGSPLYEQGTVYPWTDWEVSGFNGIEIWNLLSQWRDGITSLWRAFYLSFCNPHRALTGPYPELLARWDKLLEESPVVGIGGSDAHAIKVKLGPLKFALMDYRLSFRCINTHILTEDPFTGDDLHDAQQVYDCLSGGRCFVAYDYFMSSRGFRFSASDDGHQVQMGESVSWSPRLLLLAETPFPAWVRLIRNGQLYRTGTGCSHTFAALVPGVYRLEAYHHHRKSLRPWIFSNPIYVTD